MGEAENTGIVPVEAVRGLREPNKTKDTLPREPPLFCSCRT